MVDNCNGVNKDFVGVVIKEEVNEHPHVDAPVSQKLINPNAIDTGNVAPGASCAQETGVCNVNCDVTEHNAMLANNSNTGGESNNCNGILFMKEEVTTSPCSDMELSDEEDSGTVPIGAKVGKKVAENNLHLEDITRTRLLYRKECAEIYDEHIPHKYHTDQKTEMQTPLYKCGTCNVKCDGCAFYNHLRAKKHVKKCKDDEFLISLDQLLPPRPPNLPKPPKLIDNKQESANVPLESSVMKKCSNNNVDSAVKKPQQNKSSERLNRIDPPYLRYLKKCADIYDEHIPAKYHTDKTSNLHSFLPRYNCQACVVTGSGCEIYGHLQGEKHQQKCIGEEYLITLNPTFPPVPPIVISAGLTISNKLAKMLQHIPKCYYLSQKPKPEDNGCQRYFCWRCNKSTLDAQEFWTHLRSEKHQRVRPRDEFILKIHIDVANVEHSSLNPKSKPLFDVMLGPKTQGLEALLEGNNTNQETESFGKNRKKNLRMKERRKRMKIRSQNNETAPSLDSASTNLSSPYKYMLEKMQQSVSKDNNTTSQTPEEIPVPAPIQPISTHKTPLLDSPLEISTRIKRPLLEAPGPSCPMAVIPEKRPRIDSMQPESKSVMGSFLVVLKNTSVKTKEEAAVATQIISILSQALVDFWSCDKSRPSPEFMTSPGNSKSAMGGFLEIMKNTRIEKEEDARVATQIISTLSQALVEFRSCETSTSNRINRRSPSPEFTVATFEPKL